MRDMVLLFLVASLHLLLGEADLSMLLEEKQMMKLLFVCEQLSLISFYYYFLGTN